MSYVATKKLGKLEYRVWSEKGEPEGIVVWNGHKASIEDYVLAEILNIKKIGDKISVIKYGSPEKVWLDVDKSKPLKKLLESWETILDTLEANDGKFKKVTITKNWI
jgi:hypothetical protein